MKVPNGDRAIIEPFKLHGYLLSTSHPVGRFKAAFFATLGYAAESWLTLESDLPTQHLTQQASLTETNEYGHKYAIRAKLKGPAGHVAEVVSVWIILGDEAVPRFITAYPGDSR